MTLRFFFMFSLDKLSNIAVIGVALVVAGTNIYDRISVHPTDLPAPFAQRFMGKRLPLPNALPVGGSGEIILFISKTCHYCSQSMTFYRRLAELRSPKCNLKIVALGPKERETQADIQGYLSGSA